MRGSSSYGDRDRDRGRDRGWLKIFNRPRFGSSRVAPPPPKKFGNPGDRLRKKKWDMDQLPKFEKNFYSEHPEVHQMTFSAIAREVCCSKSVISRILHLYNDTNSFKFPKKGCSST
uniref:Uncharacterized protein n=1 Tax=Sinocyclocheilus rhinocerous TaxID=307959 RepID=A0A673HYC4_9TELE